MSWGARLTWALGAYLAATSALAGSAPPLARDSIPGVPGGQALAAAMCPGITFQIKDLYNPNAAFIVYDDGSQAIWVTVGLLKWPPNVIEAALRHELGHCQQYRAGKLDWAKANPLEAELEADRIGAAFNCSTAGAGIVGLTMLEEFLKKAAVDRSSHPTVANRIKAIQETCPNLVEGETR